MFASQKKKGEKRGKLKIETVREDEKKKRKNERVYIEHEVRTVFCCALR